MYPLWVRWGDIICSSWSCVPAHSGAGLHRLVQLPCALPRSSQTLSLNYLTCLCVWCFVLLLNNKAKRLQAFPRRMSTSHGAREALRAPPGHFKNGGQSICSSYNHHAKPPNFEKKNEFGKGLSLTDHQLAALIVWVCVYWGSGPETGFVSADSYMWMHRGCEGDDYEIVGSVGI